MSPWAAFLIRLSGAPLAAFLVLGGAALAQSTDCKNRQDQQSMNICAERDFEAADARLNQTYRARLADVGAEGRAALQQAQRAWLAWRDLQCASDAQVNQGGSIYPMVYSGCRAALTRAQTRHLAEQMNN